MPTSPGTRTTTCPSCGYRVEAGTPVCGNCGYQLSGPALPQTMASRGTGIVKFAAVLLVVAGIAALVLTQSNRVLDLLEGSGAGGSVDVTQDDGTDDDRGGGGNSSGGGDDRTGDVESPYKGVRELAAALNEGGLDCRRVQVDSADDTLATGSCQAPGDAVRTHVQINIYFFEPSLKAAEEIMKQRVFTTVHDANWFVTTQLETAREVQQILGGRLVRAK